MAARGCRTRAPLLRGNRSRSPLLCSAPAQPEPPPGAGGPVQPRPGSASARFGPGPVRPRPGLAPVLPPPARRAHIRCALGPRLAAARDITAPKDRTAGARSGASARGIAWASAKLGRARQNSAMFVSGSAALARARARLGLPSARHGRARVLLYSARSGSVEFG